MSSRLYIEGGGDSKELRARCREGFRKLFERAGFLGRMPRLVASGGRNETMQDFSIAARDGTGGFVAMLVDSEDPVDDVGRSLSHLINRDHWVPPQGTLDDQVLLMVTCMETWIIADRATLRAHYGPNLQEPRLPAPVDLEDRNRHALQDSLEKATENCSNSYKKGKRSYAIIGELDPHSLSAHLPSFARCVSILNKYL